MGVGTGLLIWGAAAAVGLAAALRSSAVLYDAFRLTCAADLATVFVGFGLRLAAETRP